MLRNRKVLSEVRCHTTAGKYVDYIRPGHSNRFPNSVVRFIETTGHYDVVLDGLNLAYYYHHFDAKKVHSMYFCICCVPVSRLFWLPCRVVRVGDG